MAAQYMDGLSQQADRLANKTITDDRLREILDELFPSDEDMTKRQSDRIQRMKEEYMVCYFAPDIAKFRGTAWGAVNAMSDMITHNMPHRNTRNYAENNWDRVMGGHFLLDSMTTLVSK